MAIELTPSTLAMRVLVRTDEAIYLRLPRELQRPIDGSCECPQCKANPELATWDTLIVPISAPKNDKHPWRYEFSGTVHMPDGSVEGFKAYCESKRRRK